MYKFLTKYGQTGALLLGVLVVAVFLIMALSGLNSAGYDMSTDLNDLPDAEKAQITFFNSGLIMALVMTAAAGFLAFVVFGIWDLIKFPKSAIQFLIGLVVLVIVFFIIYSMSDPAVPGFEEKMQENGVTDSVSKFISAGIWTSICLLGAAFIIMILSEVRNAFK